MSSDMRIPRTSRDGFLAELARYEPLDGRERAMASQLADFVRDNADAFDRKLTMGHVTGSAWVVDCSGAFALLTHHRKLGKWLQLGGHADGDTDVRRVALREAREESGFNTIVAATDDIYDLDVHAIPARRNEPAHSHYDVRFAFLADVEDTPQVSLESHAVVWVPLAEIERYAIDDSVRRLVRKTPALIARCRPDRSP